MEILSIPSISKPVETVAKSGSLPRAGIIASYSFVHDRVQQALYAVIDDVERPALHLSIATRLLDKYGDQVSGAIAFDICNQIDRGKAHVQGEDRLRFGSLNMKAARSAFDNTANSAALELLNHAGDFLPQDIWDVSAALAEEYYELKEEILASTTDYDGALEASATILKKTDNTVTRIKMYSNQIKALLSKGQLRDAVDVAAVALSCVVIDFARFLNGSTSQSDIAQAASDLWNEIPSSTDRIEAVKSLPRMTDKAALAATDLLVTILPPVYFVAPHLIEILVLTGVNATIKKGIAGYSCYYFAFLGLILCEVSVGHTAFEIADAWNETGEILLGELLQSDPRMIERASNTLTLTGCCHGFTRDSRVDGRRVFNTAINLGTRCFDSEYIAYALGNSLVGRLYEGERLNDIYSELQRHAKVVKSYKRDLGSLYTFPTLQCISNLLFSDMPNKLVSLSGDLLGNEDTAFETMKTGSLGLHLLYYTVAKLLLSLISRDKEECIRALAKACQYRNGTVGIPGKVYLELLSFLVLMDLVQQGDTALSADLKDYLEEIGSNIKVWGAQNPQKFGAWIYLWEAETTLGQVSFEKTMALYHAAIEK